jgi:hypothetical protein
LHLSTKCKQSSEGQVAEWFKAHAWNACVRESVPWVRIPPCPPDLLKTIIVKTRYDDLRQQVQFAE